MTRATAVKTRTVDRLVWIAIFGGLIVGGFGLSLRNTADALGWTLTAIGGAAIALGVVLIGLRSRMPPD